MKPAYYPFNRAWRLKVRGTALAVRTSRPVVDDPSPRVRWAGEPALLSIVTSEIRDAVRLMIPRTRGHPTPMDKTHAERARSAPYA